MTRRLGVALLLALVPAPILGGKEEGKPRIERLEAHRTGDAIALSFRVANAVSADVLQRVRSGLPVVQRHRVEAVAPRSIAIWPARELALMLIDTSAIYDTLTRRYELTRTVRAGRRKKELQTIVEERQTAESIEEVERWMSEFDRLPPLELLDVEDEERLKVRVESTLDRHFVLYLFPARLSVSAELRLGR